MKTLTPYELSKELLEQLDHGAFLTVKDKDGKLNTMTIGWGALGYMWMKPVFISMVRNTRYTFDMIEEVDEYTVSIPLKGQLKDELMTCGTKSGRDMDKFKECNLTPVNVEGFDTPVIKECDLHILCKIIYKQAMEEEHMEPVVKKVYSAEKDYHTMYYGQVMSTVLLEG